MTIHPFTPVARERIRERRQESSRRVLLDRWARLRQVGFYRGDPKVALWKGVKT